MGSTIDSFASLLKDLGDVRGATAQAARPRVNAHVHLPPNFSAFASVDQAVALAAEQGIGVLGASNYYDYTVYGRLLDAARGRGIFPIFGLEIIALIDPLVEAQVKVNDPGNYGKMYICGKGITRFDPLSAEAAALLQTIRDSDSARMAVIAGKLADVFAAAGLRTGLSAEAIKDSIAARVGCPRETVYLQERHLCLAFQEALFEQAPESARAAILERAFGAAPKSPPGDAVGIQNEIRSQLMKAGKPAFVEDTFVDFDHAYRLILALGGMPCYPTLADGAAPICGYEEPVDRLIADLKERGVHAAEFIPNRNKPEVLRRYVTAMRKAGLAVTAGTEHNTLDLLPIEPTCLGGEPIPDDIKAIFWEGACVAAAHQYLTLLGRPGFVDAGGAPNADYPSADARIAAFASLGESVIAAYAQAAGKG